MTNRPAPRTALVALTLTLAGSSVHAQQTTFPAMDGATVYATWYRSQQPALAVILAFADPGAHGSSMLVAERVGAPVGATWYVVLEFLNRVSR